MGETCGAVPGISCRSSGDRPGWKGYLVGISIKVISDASMEVRTVFWAPMLAAQTSFILFPPETVSLCFLAFAPRMDLPEGGWALTDIACSKCLLCMGYEPNVILCSGSIVVKRDR